MIKYFIYIFHFLIFIFSTFGIFLFPKYYYKYLLINKLIIIYLWLICDGCILRKIENYFEESNEDKYKSFFYKIMECFKLNYIIDDNKHMLNVIINMLAIFEILYICYCLEKINFGIYIILIYYSLNVIIKNKLLMETL